MSRSESDTHDRETLTNNIRARFEELQADGTLNGFEVIDHDDYFSVAADGEHTSYSWDINVVDPDADEDGVLIEAHYKNDDDVLAGLWAANHVTTVKDGIDAILHTFDEMQYYDEHGWESKTDAQGKFY